MKMTKPKAINRKKLVAFALLVSNNSLHTVAHPGSRYFYLKEDSPMPRKKKPQTLPELYAVNANIKVSHLTGIRS